jgi:hypothetical protein
VLVGVIDEMVQMTERIDHDVEANHAQEADDEHLNKLAQQVTIDDFRHKDKSLASAAKPNYQKQAPPPASLHIHGTGATKVSHVNFADNTR